MTELLLRELHKVGLHLNVDKTKILHSSSGTLDADRDYADIDGELVQILHEDQHHRYLGRHLNLSEENRCNIEIRNRKHQAWSAFQKHKKVLLNPHVSLGKRLHLFDICVSPAMLYSLVCFPISKHHLNEIDILQRKMLRCIVGWRRVPSENWEDTMRRMRSRLEYADELYHCQKWSDRLLRDQWRFALHLTTDGAPFWARSILKHSSNSVNDDAGRYISHRCPGRPRQKWDDRLKFFFRNVVPDHRDTHWSEIMRAYKCVDLEDVYCSFNFSASNLS